MPYYIIHKIDDKTEKTINLEDIKFTEISFIKKDIKKFTGEVIININEINLKIDLKYNTELTFFNFFDFKELFYINKSYILNNTKEKNLESYIIIDKNDILDITIKNNNRIIFTLKDKFLEFNYDDKLYNLILEKILKNVKIPSFKVYY